MRRTPIVSVMLLLVAACGGESGTATTAEATTIPVTTTAAPVTTTTAAVTTTAAPVTTTTVATTTTAGIFYAVTPDMPPVLGSPGDPHGSGCAPPPGDVLPDGIWFGEVVGFGGFTDPAAPAAMSFDLACYFTGDAATQARIADGMSGESDYDEYVRNQNPKIYEVLLSPSAEVWSIPGTGSFFPELIPVSAWPRPDGYFTCPGEPGEGPGAFCPVWIYVNGGVVTGFVEMFFE